MKIRKPCNLARMYAGPQHPIDAASPELRFMEAVCAGRAEEAAGFFCGKKLFGREEPAVDAPYGRFTGLAEIRAFAEDFNARFGAELSFLTPVIQTRANGRVVSELVVNFVVDGEIEEVPMFVVGDLREGVEFFDRKHRTIMASNSATAGDYNAFSGDLVILRAIEREDVVKRDGAAFVRLELDTTVSNME